MTDQLAQVRIAAESRTRDVTIVVNNRKIDNVTRYAIEQESTGDTLPHVHLALVGIDGVEWAARVARVIPTTKCTSCGFTHREATLPISENDVAEIEQVLYALQNPITANLEARLQYVESLLRDVRDTLNAFFPSGPQLGEPDRTPLLIAAVEDEVDEGRPSADLATGAAGVGFAREALASKRRRSAEERTPEAGSQTDDSGSGSSGGSYRGGEDGSGRMGSDESGLWPDRDGIYAEDPED